MKKNDNYISTPEKGVFFAFPIYDMSSKDVWKVVSDKQEDYNRTYDVFNKTEMYENFLRQRVCPPYGEEPVRGLHIYAECFPEMWERMINRVKGAATAARYGNTELYSSGYKPDQVSWRDHVQNVLDSFDDATKPKVAKVLNSAIKQHKNKTSDKIPEVDPHPLSGCSWSFLSKIVTRGDLKGRIIQNMQQQAEKTRNSMGITMQEAEKLYGKK